MANDFILRNAFLDFRHEVESYCVDEFLEQLDITEIKNEQGDIIGFIGARIGTHEVYIDSLYIVPAYRRQGYAKRAVLDFLNQQFGKTVSLSIVKQNKPANDFWRSICNLDLVQDDGIDVDYVIESIRSDENESNENENENDDRPCGHWIPAGAEVRLYADGACSGNPGPGGYGAVVVYGDYHMKLSGGDESTTNNRMELSGVIAGLNALPDGCHVTVVSDSKYVTDAFNKRWIDGWMRDGKVRETTPNFDLWNRLLDVMSRHTVVYEWVKGHAGNPMNELCDDLAVTYRKEHFGG